MDLWFCLQSLVFLSIYPKRTKLVSIDGNLYMCWRKEKQYSSFRQHYFYDRLVI